MNENLPISQVDRKFREISNIMNMLDMLTMGFYGEISDTAKEKVINVKDNMHSLIDFTNNYIQELFLQEQYIAKMKDEFVSNINHELRTPITSILSTVDFLIQRFDEIDIEMLKSRIERIKRSTNNLLLLVNELLDLSRIENLELKPVFAGIKLNDVFDKLQELFEPIAVSKNLDLIFIQTDLVLKIDFDHIFKILSNLIGNALKFTFKGYIKIKSFSDGDYITISVEDTGKGIMPEDLKKIFERYNKGKY